MHLQNAARAQALADVDWVCGLGEPDDDTTGHVPKHDAWPVGAEDARGSALPEVPPLDLGEGYAYVGRRREVPTLGGLDGCHFC